MKILVTGGAGYIGGIITDMLVQDGMNVTVIDDLSEGNREAVSDVAQFCEGDFGNKDVLENLFSTHSFDIVIHLAALASVPDSLKDPLDYYDNNVKKTLCLIKMMKCYGVRKMIFSSTAAVYGIPKKQPITEIFDTEPINPYGWSKLMIEKVLKDLFVAEGLKSISFRYFCASGATKRNGESRKKKETHLIPLMVDATLSKKSVLEVFGDDFETRDGTGVRDYIHVQDIARAHLLGLYAIEELKHEVFNLGTEKGYSVLEVINKGKNILGSNIPYEITARRSGDPACLVASAEKVKKQLGWEPQFGLEEMIESTYEWRRNPLY